MLVVEVIVEMLAVVEVVVEMLVVVEVVVEVVFHSYTYLFNG